MRGAWLALIALGAVACGGRESAGSAVQSSASSSTAANSVANTSSSTASSATKIISGLPSPPPCLVGPVGPGLPINVYGVDCFPGGPMTGSCTEGTPACSYCALPVLCTPSYGPRTSYACVCSGGTWSCTVEWQDGSVCPPSEAGAADAEANDADNVTSDGAVCGAGEVVCGLGGCGPDTACFWGACPTPSPVPCPR